MRVEPSKQLGRYDLVTDNGVMLRSGVTHAEAWRAMDKISGEATSRAQDVSDWAFRKGASGE
jgi:hypothetical protein